VRTGTDGPRHRGGRPSTIGPALPDARRRAGAGRRALLAASVIALVSRAHAYRGLESCPALTPVEPIAGVRREARRCRAAIANAGRSYLAGVLAAKAVCLDRIAQGVAADDPAALCRGLRRLSTGAFDLPTDPDTATAVGAARAALEAEVMAACTDADIAELALCGATAVSTVAAAAACVAADHWDHVEHVLDQLYGPGGDVAPIADPEAASCHAAVTSAMTRFVSKQHGSMGRCVGRARGRGGHGRIARQCLGIARNGDVFPPRDPATQARVHRAVARLGTTIRKRCSDAAIAALGLCGDDRSSLGSCLVCVGCRETMLALGAAAGGAPARPATAFIGWGVLRNPVLGFDDRRLKDQAIGYADGWFHVFASVGFADDDPEAETKERSFYRTRDFQTFEPFRDDDLNAPGQRVDSPDLVQIDDVWHMVFQRPDPDLPENGRLALSTSADLRDWGPPIDLVPGILPDQSIIDGALARRGDHYFLGFKWRAPQQFHVTRSETMALDQRWLPAERALAPVDHFFRGFAENYQFVDIDGALRMIATARDPEGLRCPNFFTCSHEPFIYELASGDGDDLTDWRLWRRKTQLAIPYEDWNPVMHANTGFLDDWRGGDGFFYLSYAGSLDSDSFQGRGHGKIGLARSRDLVHWRLPGDVRD